MCTHTSCSAKFKPFAKKSLLGLELDDTLSTPVEDSVHVENDTQINMSIMELADLESFDVSKPSSSKTAAKGKDRKKQSK